MKELYAEASVKKGQTLKDLFLKSALIGIAVLSLLLTAVSQVLIIITTVVIMVVVYIFPRLNIQYEYIFCDGQFDFDKLMGNSKRKTVMVIDMEYIDIIAPTGSHELDQFNNKNPKVKNFSSLKQDAKTYVIMGHYKNELVKIIFEPNEKMLECIKLKAPRKLVKY